MSAKKERVMRRMNLRLERKDRHIAALRAELDEMRRMMADQERSVIETGLTPEVKRAYDAGREILLGAGPFSTKVTPAVAWALGAALCEAHLGRANWQMRQPLEYGGIRNIITGS